MRESLNTLETTLGIVFIQPDAEQLEDLYRRISIPGSTAETELPQPPIRGFLSKPLTDEQKKKSDQVLGPEYAKEAVALQDKLIDIPIEECGEPMVHSPSLFQANEVPLSTSIIPFSEACGEWANKQRIYWIRESVANRLLNMGQSLKKIGIKLHLEDAFRPIGVQEGLFSRRIKLILREHPEWSEDWDKVWTEARSKTAVCPGMAGHKSGAAVDITLQTLDGNPLPLGNRYPDGGPRVALHFPYVTQEEWATRMLFAYATELHGLRIYPFENWHASAGDLSAGIAFGKTNSVTPQYRARFGPIKSFDPQTGNIVSYAPPEYFQPFFSKEELLRKIE